jgi:hypothetical protein
MTARAAFLALVFVAGCASSPQPVPGATAPAPGAAAFGPPPATERTYRPAASAGASDWALAIVGTPFVFAFRTVVCAATAVVAGPTAALFAVSEDPRGGFLYLRDGLAQNCGPPWAIGVPAAGYGYRDPAVGYGYRDPAVVYAPAPELDRPRPLTPYGRTAVMSR